MGTSACEERVIEIIDEILPIDKKEINLDSWLEDDLGADSLDLVTLEIKIEDEFNVNIFDAETDTIRHEIKTVRQLIDYINNELAKITPPAPAS
jgi:acyl carrier protein